MRLASSWQVCTALFVGVMAWLPATLEAQDGATLRLRVLAHETGKPLVGSLVRVHETSQEVVSDADGRVTISGIAPGMHTVTVSLHGYKDERMEIGFPSGGLVQGEVQLVTKAVVLETIEVIVSRNHPRLSRGGFFERERRGSGQYLAGPELRRRAARSVSIADLVRGFRGVIAAPAGGSWALRSTRGEVRFASERGERCEVQVIMDHMPLSFDEAMSVIHPSHVVGIEFYSGPAVVPPEFNVEASCGVLVVWTG